MKTGQDYSDYIKEELIKYDKPITKSILKLVEEHKDMDKAVLHRAILWRFRADIVY